MTDVTEILHHIESGKASASEQLLPLVYDELRKLAAAKMINERPDHTLNATALVHEAYMRLTDGQLSQQWNGRGQFFAAAAEAMRRILVDRARRHRAMRHGGGLERVDYQEIPTAERHGADQLLILHDALERLEAEAPEKAELVKLRYFAGLSHQEAAQALGISRATADRYWAYARVFLHCAMEDAEKI